MDEIESYQRRATRLKELVREYFDMEYGELIERHQELLRVCDIRESKHEKHPHDGMRVYISRRLLKHFVEVRKYELERRHADEEMIDKLNFVIDALEDTLINFDTYEFTPPKHFYIVNYSGLGMPILRVLVEEKDGILEICFIHFKTLKTEK